MPVYLWDALASLRNATDFIRTAMEKYNLSDEQCQTIEVELNHINTAWQRIRFAVYGGGDEILTTLPAMPLSAKEAELSQLRERIANLEEALKPFASLSTLWANKLYVREDSTTTLGNLTVGDFRRAKTVYEGKG